MRRPLLINEAAAAELSETVRWYEAQRPGLGAELLEAITAAFDIVAESPQRGSSMPNVAGGRLRRLLAQRFPYQVIYEPRPADVAVIAWPT